LVHGTTQSPADWNLLAGELRERGHGVITVDMPTDKPEWTVAGHAGHAAVQAGEPSGSRVVVAHSGAGVY
jgi:hypothetical protein